MTNPAAPRPFCAEVARAGGEPLSATASRVEQWLLVEYTGYWPYEPLDAPVFAGELREHLAAQLAALRPARLVLVKRRDRGDGVVRVLHGRTPERGGAFHRIELDRHRDLLDLDLTGRGRAPGEPVSHPLLLVCTHGIRDRCCARYGQALYRELARHTDQDWLWQASHVGGDRFAGNLVVLPEGLYFGRVGPEDAAPLFNAYRDGRIDLDRYRGRSCYPFPVQAAEHHVRRTARLTGIDDLRLVEVRREGSTFEVVLREEATGARHEVVVVAEHGEPTFLTCKAREPRRPLRFVVR